MYIFEIEGGVAKPTTFALITEPFKSMWELDTHASKKGAIQMFTYVELFTSRLRSNPFAGMEETERSNAILQNMFGENATEGRWLINAPLVTEGVKVYKELMIKASPSLRLLNSAEKSMENLQEFLEGVDLNERTDKGMAIYKPRDITSAVKDLKEVTENLISLRDRVHTELLDSVKTRRNRDVGHFEE